MRAWPDVSAARALPVAALRWPWAVATRWANSGDMSALGQNLVALGFDPPKPIALETD